MKQQQHKVIISGGGTGGHIFPAIAIANALRKRDEFIEILFVGALGKMEMEKVPKAGYHIEGLPIAGMQRSFSLKNLTLPFKVIESLMKARNILKKYMPDAVIGVGGYASGPVLFAATMLGIPCLIQEQNSYAGITNRILSKRVNKVCVAYSGMEQFFPAAKMVVTGNPVRKDIVDVESKRAEALQFFELSSDRKTLLILGGSLGARTINESIRIDLKKLFDQNIQLIWQTGKGYYRQNEAAAQPFLERIKVYEFIDRMDLAYAAADVVISRAGALSIAELCVAGKPCILVPSPNVAEDHQTKNALALAQRNAALILEDNNAKEKLVDTVLNLFADVTLQQKLKMNILQLARPNADDDIVKEILKLIEDHNGVKSEAA